MKFSVTIFLKAETVVRTCSVKKVFLKISQNSQEKTCARASSFNIKREDSGTSVFLWILRNF